jgi:5-formyltetrahydrofolate cyclo-ligase
MPDRESLRRKIRNHRQELSDDEIFESSWSITRHLIESSQFKSSKRIACYLSTGGEVDTQFILDACWSLNKTVLLPTLSPLGDGKLWFVRHEPGQTLRMNRYSIAEPVFSRRDLMRPAQIDLVLAPLVAFDGQGHRLGMGGGYYDRTFAFLNQRSHWQRPWFIGLAYEFQQVPQLESHFWDVNLQGIVTESHFRMFRS